MSTELLYEADKSILLKKVDCEQYTPEEFAADKMAGDHLFVDVDVPLKNEPHRFTVRISEVGTIDELLERVTRGYGRYVGAQQKVAAAKHRLEMIKKNSKAQKSDLNIDWKSLVLQEEQFRLSDDVQQEYKNRETDASFVDWIEYTATVVQPRLLEMNGIAPTPTNLHHLRVAAQETEVFWVKYNRARQGDYRVGDMVPSNVILYDTQKNTHIHIDTLCNTPTSARTTSSSTNSYSRPVVLLAGSES